MSLYKYAKTLADMKREHDVDKAIIDLYPVAGGVGGAAGALVGHHTAKTGDPQMKWSKGKLKRVDQRQYHVNRSPAARAAFHRQGLGKGLAGAAAGALLGHVAGGITHKVNNLAYRVRVNNSQKS